MDATENAAGTAPTGTPEAAPATQNENQSSMKEAAPASSKGTYRPMSEFISNVLKQVPLSLDPEVPVNTFAEIDGSEIDVRGENYLVDRIKVKSRKNALTLLGVDVYKSDEPIYHLMSHPDFKPREFTEQPNAPKVIMINFLVWADVYFHLCIFFEVPETSSENVPDYLYDSILDFVVGDDEYRNSRFKVMGLCPVGSWMTRRIIGSTPCLVANKLTTTYYTDDKYFEVDLDVNSSKVATWIFSQIRGVFKQIVIDLAFWIEGKTEDELPEQIWSGIRINHVDMDGVVANSPRARTKAELEQSKSSTEADAETKPAAETSTPATDEKQQAGDAKGDSQENSSNPVEAKQLEGATTTQEPPKPQAQAQ